MGIIWSNILTYFLDDIGPVVFIKSEDHSWLWDNEMGGGRQYIQMPRSVRWLVSRSHLQNSKKEKWSQKMAIFVLLMMIKFNQKIGLGGRGKGVIKFGQGKKGGVVGWLKKNRAKNSLSVFQFSKKIYTKKIGPKFFDLKLARTKLF